MSVSIGIDNVVKKYGDMTIIPDLSAFIKNGEFFTLLYLQIPPQIPEKFLHAYYPSMVSKIADTLYISDYLHVLSLIHIWCQR